MAATAPSSVARTLPPGRYQTPRQRYESLRTSLVNDRDSSWRPHWQDIGDYLLPRRVRWNNATDRNRGDKRNQKIVDSTATYAHRTLRSGMMSGITSPARPWFRLSTPDPDLAEYGPVKDWLHIVTSRMREVFLRSNFYKALPTIYGDIGGFGTAAAALLEDTADVIRAYAFPLGSYVLATSDRSVVDTFIRDYTMTVRQLVIKFGEYDPRTGRAMWEAFSQHVRTQWDAGNYETPVEVVHVVAPNLYADPRRLQAKFKPWASCYYELASREYGPGDRDKFLRESGFDEFPVLAPRWDLASPDDVYGGSCPGMEALGDIKALQLLQKRKAEAIEKMVRPPLTAPGGLRNQKVSQIPGDVTYFDSMQGRDGVKPMFEVKPDIQGLMLDIQDHQARIRRAFFEDLFLMVSSYEGTQPRTAEEIAALKGEQLLMLGPVLEHLNDELLNASIDRTFAIMLRKGLIPPPPKELESGSPLKVEYISIMHQAQKLVAAGAMDRFLERVGIIAKIDPAVVDKVDRDQVVDEYADIYGVPPRTVVPDEQVAAAREQRVAAQQAAQRAAFAESAAKTAQTLSATDTAGQNALTDIARAAGQGVVPV